MIAELSANTHQTYQPFYDQLAAGWGVPPDPVDARATDLLLHISRDMTLSQYNAIVNNKRDIQSKELSFCHAAQESGFARVELGNGQSQGIVGPDNDLGLFQIQLPSAQDAAKRLGIGQVTMEQVRDNDALNTQLATNHLQHMINLFGGDVRTALGAYKQGRQNVLDNGLTVKSQRYADAVLQCERRLQGRR